MAIGTLNQTLKIRSLPKGVTLKVVDVQLKLPGGGDWWPTFNGNGKLLTKNNIESEKKRMLPFEISPSHNDGLIGTVGLTSLAMLDSGAGPSVVLDIEFSAAEKPNASPAVCAKASITVSSDDWGSWTGIWKFQPWARPDNTIVSYSLTVAGSTTKQETRNKNLQLQSPNDVDVLVAVNAETNQLGMYVSVNSDRWKTAFDWALSGIFWGHKEAVGWVFGELGWAIPEAAEKAQGVLEYLQDAGKED